MKLLSHPRFPLIFFSLATLVVVLWFTVPNLLLNIKAEYNRPPGVISVNLSEEQKDKIKTDIARLELAIKKGDKLGASTLMGDYLGLGQDYEVIGRLDLAEDAYDRAALQNETSFIPQANLGSLYQTRKEFDKSERAYRKAIALEPTEVSTYKKLAELYRYRMMDDGKARGVYIEGLASTHNHPDLMRTFASFLEQIGERTEAKLYYAELLKQNPQDQSLKDALKRITPGK